MGSVPNFNEAMGSVEAHLDSHFLKLGSIIRGMHSPEDIERVVVDIKNFAESNNLQSELKDYVGNHPEFAKYFEEE